MGGSAAEPSLLRFFTAGSVDDGKSTLIGRLLYECQGVYEDQLDAVQKATPAGSGDLELAYITDGLRAEREQGITIDVAYRHFATPRRRFIIADTPGHEQYTRNTVTGASTADLAVVMLDARKGVLPQTRRHAFIAYLLGIRDFVVVVNKMDLVGYSRDVYDAICFAFREFTGTWDLESLVFIPVSALNGHNVVRPGGTMPWHQGPVLLEHLENITVAPARNLDHVRMPVQYVIRRPDFRGYAGQLVSGILRPGDPALVLPSRRQTRVSALCSYDGNQAEAFPTMSITVCLEDEVDVSRGDMLVDPTQVPAVDTRFGATLVWMSDKPLRIDQPYLIKLATQQVCASVTRLHHIVDIGTMAPLGGNSLRLNEIGEVSMESQRALVFDCYRQNRATGAFILIDFLSNETVAAGMISGSAANSAAVTAPAMRDEADVERDGAVVWFTGLSGAGKTTISRSLCDELIARGHRVELLDGDIVRKHLSKGLGFSRDDREENIRRIGFVARLLSRNGVIAVVSAISPYRLTRDEVRREIPKFLEVYVNAPLDVCEQRDPKGLYKQARTGQLLHFTGVDDPYEPPLAPEIECHTDRETVEECVARVLELIENRLH